MQCPNCQNEVRPGQLFCDNCGRDLSDLQAPATSDAPDPDNAASSAEANPPSAPAAPVEDAAAEEPPAVQPTPSVTAAEAPPVAQAAPPAAAPPVTPAAGAQLIIKDGGATYDLPAGGEILVGRVDPLDGIYPDIDLTPHDPAVGVSRRHAIFHEQGGQWFLKDNQSTNYTVVNRQRLNPDQDYLLDDGDEIRFGRVVASFHIV